jgi:LuxR family transcriptional regulator, maltose regulon positive regulatory protein
MSQGDAIPRSPLVAEFDRTETKQVLEAARALIEVAPRELSWRDHATLAAYVALHRPDPAECHRLLAHSLAASPVASQAFARFPKQMTELCIEALRSSTETVRDLIKQHSPQSPARPKSGSWPFKVFVLGRFQVLKDDAPIRFSRRQQRKPLELLQALIAFGGTEVGASKLTDALWPDSEGDAGYHALESALYRLRQLLGAPSAVVMAGGKLTLDRRQVWVDMWAFESELQAGNGDDSGPAERLARLRELYSGHFLVQEVEKTWAVEKRQILRERFVRAIGDFARSYEKRGSWQEAAGVYQVGIEVDSLAEEFHRGLILCHRELGDHAAAVKAYRRCSELLLKRLGVQPSSKTLALYRSVRHEGLSQAV